MLNHVEFRSDSFPAYDGEDEEVNPGRYGKRLAEFLHRELRSHGIDVEDIFPEDWGWVIPVREERFNLWIGVGNYEEYEDGFLCFIEPRKPEIRQFPQFWKKVSTRERIEEVQQALDRILSSGDKVAEVKWWTHEEFNYPSESGT